MTHRASLSVRTFVCAIFMGFVPAAQCGSAQAQSAPVRQAFERGAAAMRSGHAQAAETAFRDAVKLAPDLAEAHLDLGLVLGREGKLEEAIAAMQKAISLSPAQPSAHMFLGIFLFQANHPEEARQALQAELAIDPKNTEALTWLGNVDMTSGHPERAIVSFDRAAELSPNDADLLELRGRAHTQVAHDSYARMAKLYPNSWHVHRVQAQLLGDEGRHQEAIKEYEAAIKLEARNPDLYEGLGDELRAVSQMDAAKAAFQKELTLAPANPVAMYNLGSVDVERGDSAEGVPLLQSMVALRPGLPVAEYYLGRGLSAIDRDEEAVHWLEEAGGSNADFEVRKRSLFELTRVYRKLHRTAEAQTALVKYNQVRETQEKATTQEMQDWQKLGQATARTGGTGASAQP